MKQKAIALQNMPTDEDELVHKKRFRSTYDNVPKQAKLMHSVVEKKGGQFHVYHMGKLMNEVNKMTTGQTFGEIALMSVESTRTATVLCSRDSEFAVLDRMSYNVRN